ncbi:MAG: cyclic pyranopterin monophosphate synthase MoaC [Planctomycetes bacterium]|nr:cyclic pyranopterin monophosphate synthase MoaC [Planctomycetota bacterium]
MTRSRTARLSHVDAKGAARMVDVLEKPVTARRAVAEAIVRVRPSTLALARGNAIRKGRVFDVARLAGIVAAKRCPDLIPLCHPTALTSTRVDVEAWGDRRIRIEAEVRALDRTGVEMEALTAAAVAALTVYDMLKAVERGITIESVRLLEKEGGKSGRYARASAKLPATKRRAT